MVWSPHKGVFFLLFVKTHKNIRMFISRTLSIYFCRGHSVVVSKQKDNKIVSGINQIQQYIILFYLDDINNILVYFILMTSTIYYCILMTSTMYYFILSWWHRQYIILFYLDDINNILFYFILMTSTIYYFIYLDDIDNILVYFIFMTSTIY
jgi:hypothetical protein